MRRKLWKSCCTASGVKSRSARTEGDVRERNRHGGSMVKHLILVGSDRLRLLPGRRAALTRRPSRPSGHLRSRHAHADRATAGTKAVLTKEEAAKLEKDTAAQKDKGNEAIKARSARASQGWRWINRRGRKRQAAITSSGSIPARDTRLSMDKSAPHIVVDPAEGRVPPYNPGRAQANARSFGQGQHRTRRRAGTPASSRPAPMTIPNASLG